jgi:hypothetical protein
MFSNLGRRLFVYFCAFVGAAWFGDWVYGAAKNGSWDSSFTWIILASFAFALLFALLAEPED